MADSLDVHQENVDDARNTGLGQRRDLSTPEIDPIDCQGSQAIDPEIRVLSGRIDDHGECIAIRPPLAFEAEPEPSATVALLGVK